jgi:hypothetical protein
MDLVRPAASVTSAKRSFSVTMGFSPELIRGKSCKLQEDAFSAR